MAYGNNVLDSIIADDLVEFGGAVRRILLERGEVLLEAGTISRVMHFPVTTQLANVSLLANGGGVETSVVGREGVSGLAAFLADTECGWQIVVQRSGEAFVAPVAAVQALRRRSPAFDRLLLRLSYFYQLQAAQTAACNAAHRLQQRLARWLLSIDDATPGEPVAITQEEVALFLGAQRTTVQDAMSNLRALGAIAYRRGVISLRDRAVLEGQVCECYGILRDAEQHLGLVPDTGNR
ncbi:MAG: Crp/Fnr family transcriptional regulator [Zymomonas sp.]|nr:MAG: Crp/Fnr family transcriptional regulator [Zymomonas sp.]